MTEYLVVNIELFKVERMWLIGAIVKANEDIFEGFFTGKKRIGMWLVFRAEGERADALEHTFNKLAEAEGIGTKVVKRMKRIPSFLRFVTRGDKGGG